MEMSAMWHHFWQYRTRWQAWDYPQRGHRRFVDLHAAEVNGGLLLPLHLGWWNFQAYDPPQIEPTFPEVMENLGARLIGWDAGISLTAGVNRDALRKTPLFRRAVDILRTCEDLRHANVFDEPSKARLREPGSEFTLTTNAAGKVRFRRLQSSAHTLAGTEPWTLAWTITNRFASQPLRFRLEALSGAPTPADTNAIRLADLGRMESGAWKRASAEGVSFNVTAAEGAGDFSAVVVATNAGRAPRHAAWLRVERRFDPPLDLRRHQALRVGVEGDGSGALLVIRLESPRHLAFGAVADRYATVDFTGTRWLTLVETESARWSDFTWNDGKGLYNVYRETIHFDAIESVSVWLQNLPPDRQIRLRLSPVSAVPMRPATISNTRLTVAGQTVELPVSLESGCWIEANGPDACEVFGPMGEPRGQVTPRGDWPLLPAGAVSVECRCEGGQDAAARARLTVFSHGEEL
jgi:hypothetical protein